MGCEGTGLGLQTARVQGSRIWRYRARDVGLQGWECGLQEYRAVGYRGMELKRQEREDTGLGMKG